MSEAQVADKVTINATDAPFSFPQNIVRNLSDKLKDKRRIAGDEIESMVRKLMSNKDEQGVKQVLLALNNQFVNSVQPSMKKGGLWGLASVSIALNNKGIAHFMEDLVPPVLKCFSDHDAKVRFHACEALYNIAKVARSYTIKYFEQIFDGMCKLSADPDSTVRNANTLLDRLMKDIVTEDEHFDVEHFIPLIRGRILSNNPYIRQFLVGWIMILDSVPDINMLEYLPQFLSGLFNMLSDPNKEIVQQATSVLDEFLTEITESADSVNYGPLVLIIISYAVSDADRTREKSLFWIYKFLQLKQHEKLIPYYAKLVAVVLPSISHKQESIRDIAALANKELILAMQRSENNQIEFNQLIHIIKIELEKFSIPSRIVALNWVHVLLNKDIESVMKVIDNIFLLLLKILSDPSDEVVSLDLEVLAIIASTESNFVKFLRNLVNMFRSDQKLFKKAGFIIRQLCVMLNPEKIYRELSKILQTYTKNLQFCSNLIQIMNMTLLTTKELSELRELIKKGSSSAESTDLFQELYKSWCHNPVATLTLCLLAKNYKHASELVKTFSQIDVSVSFLSQIDNLVQLIESPVFVDLRLQLLEPAKEIYLLKTLYGILMLLPQSTAYEKLNNRLQCVNSLSMLHFISTKNESTTKDQEDPVNEELLKHFISVQQNHNQSLNTEF